MTRRSWALFAAMCVIWGIPTCSSGSRSATSSRATLVFLRTAIGGLMLLPLALSRGGFGPVLRRWRPLLAFTVDRDRRSVAVARPTPRQHLSSSLTGLLVAAVPLIGVLVARLLGSARRASIAGALVGLLLGWSGSRCWSVSTSAS